jgi:hypothetical protein
MKSLSEPITIVTKKYDGGSNKKKRKSHVSGDNNFDAFLHYSSREIRMKALLGHREDNLSQSSLGNRTNLPVHRRETRISFELHPSLLVMDLMHDESLRDEAKIILLQ